MDLLGSCSCLKAFWLKATPAWGSHSNMHLFEYGGFPPLWSLNTENDDNKPSTIWASLFWVKTSVWGAGLFHCLFSILQSALWFIFCTFGFKYFFHNRGPSHQSIYHINVFLPKPENGMTQTMLMNHLCISLSFIADWRALFWGWVATTNQSSEQLMIF